MLLETEYLDEKAVFEYFDLSGVLRSIELDPRKLAFTYCMVPVEYRNGEENSVVVSYSNGETETFQGHELPEQISSEIFNRTGKISKVDVNVN